MHWLWIPALMYMVALYLAPAQVLAGTFFSFAWLMDRIDWTVVPSHCPPGPETPGMRQEELHPGAGLVAKFLVMTEGLCVGLQIQICEFESRSPVHSIASWRIRLWRV